MPNAVFDNPTFSANNHVFDNPVFVTGAASIVSLSTTTPQPGDTVTATLSGGSGSETFTLGGEAITPDSQTAVQAVFTWPSLHTGFTGALRYLTAHNLVMVSSGSSQSVTTQVPTGYTAQTISGWTAGGDDDIFDDDTGVANGQQVLSVFTAGAGTLNADGTVALTTLPSTLRYWLCDDSTWGGPADEVFNPSDTTAPVLSGLGVSNIRTTLADVAVTTDEGAGTLYVYVSQSITPPSYADHVSGTGADAHTTLAVTATGVLNVTDVGALLASTQYYAHVFQRDAASPANDSTQLTSDPFTTAAAVNLGWTDTLRNYANTADIADGPIEYRVEQVSDDSLLIDWTSGSVVGGVLTIDNEAFASVGNECWLRLRRGSTGAWTLSAMAAVSAVDLNA